MVVVIASTVYIHEVDVGCVIDIENMFVQIHGHRSTVAHYSYFCDKDVFNKTLDTSPNNQSTTRRIQSMFYIAWIFHIVIVH